MDAKRYTDIPFPSYRYVPGQAPHPTGDPEGHSYNEPMKVLPPFNMAEWRDCEEYLFGIDLFNHRYWWEAHESLEAVWVAAGRTTETGYFVQGLIQIGVAMLKNFQGYTDVGKTMAHDGLDKMKTINGVYMGIDMQEFRPDVEKFIGADKPENIIITLHMTND